MGYSNATGPSVRHTITLSQRLTDALAEYCEASGGIPASEAVRRGLALLLDDPSLASMNPRGQPKKVPAEEPPKTKAKPKLPGKSKISHKRG